MDATAEIKNNLISRIKNSTDLSFLKALQTIFDSSEQSLYPLSTDQKKAIETGKKQIENGQFSENEKVISEMRAWLLKK